TVIVITGKHGESPLGPTRTIAIFDSSSPGLSPIGAALSAAGIQFNRITAKTSALIWLKDSGQTMAAVAALSVAPGVAPFLKQVLSFGNGLPFPQPGTGSNNTDPAPPDIVLWMNDGVNFEPNVNSTTHAEHGGFGQFETHVPLLVSHSNWSPVSVTGTGPLDTVDTRRIAPTVLTLLGLDPNSLQAVQIEHTPVLQEVVNKLQ